MSYSLLMLNSQLGGAKFSQGRPDSPGPPLAPALPYSDKIESFEQIYTQYWTKLISI